MKRRVRRADRDASYAVRLASYRDREIFVARSAISVNERTLESVLSHHSLKAILLG